MILFSRSTQVAILAAACCLFALPVFAPVQAQTSNWEVLSLSGEELAEHGALVDLETVEFHIPAGSITEDITLRVLERGAFNEVQEEVERLPKRFKSKQQVVQYDISGEESGETVDTSSVVVRMPYYGTKDRRRRVFYTERDATAWSKVRSRVNIGEQYVQVDLPANSGLLVVGGHKSKKEIPVKEANFAQYTGMPYSDTAAVIDVKSGRFLYRNEAKKQRSIASVTKIMTGMIYEDSQTNGAEAIAYSQDYERIGATAAIEFGETLLKDDVLMATLVRSANNMAVTLANSTDMTEAEFVNAMNAKAARLKLKKTVFHEPTGLDSDNISTAGNLAKLGRYAFTRYATTFEEAADYSSYTFQTQNTGRTVTVRSTNKFDGRGLYELTAFKTGYLPGTADRTLVAQITEIGSDAEIVVVLLGNPQYNTIFEEAYALAHWTFSNWHFQNY